MKQEMHEEYLVQVMHRYSVKEGHWSNAIRYMPDNKINQRYAESEEQAKAVLDNAYKKWNGQKVYDANGERRTTQAAGMIGVGVVHTKETDKDLEIVKHRIRKRLVSDWELVEEE